MDATEGFLVGDIIHKNETHCQDDDDDDEDDQQEEEDEDDDDEKPVKKQVELTNHGHY